MLLHAAMLAQSCYPAPQQEQVPLLACWKSQIAARVFALVPAGVQGGYKLSNNVVTEQLAVNAAMAGRR